VLGGKQRNNSIAASNPPAESPMSTMGQYIFFFGALARAVCLADLGRADFSDSMLFARAVHPASQPWLPFMLLAAFP
jgi:hypothetical protein